MIINTGNEKYEINQDDYVGKLETIETPGSYEKCSFNKAEFALLVYFYPQISYFVKQIAQVTETNFCRKLSVKLNKLMSAIKESA